MTVSGEPSESTFAVLLGIFGAFFFVIIAILIAWYVFQALGFYKLAKNRGIPHAWVAWIPVCQYYLLGDLIGNEVWGFGYANWILVIGHIISALFTTFSSSSSEVVSSGNLFAAVSSSSNPFVTVLGLIFGIVFYVYFVTALYKLYKIYSNKPVLFCVLTVIFPFLEAIFVFMMRNNQPKPLDQVKSS